MAHEMTQTEWEQMMCEKVFAFVQKELYLDMRYFKIALCALKPKPVDGLKTLACDGVNLCYSREQVLRVFKDNSLFLNRAYLHTVLHCVYRHLWLLGPREKELWNLACDIVSEYTIDSMENPSTKRILSFLRREMYGELREEKNGISGAVVYRVLQKKSREELAVLAREFYTDDHRFWESGEKESISPLIRQAKDNWDKIARQTALEQNRKGKDKTSGEEFLSAQLKAAKSRRTYGEFLKKFSVWQEEMHCDQDEFDLGFYSYGLKVYGNMPLVEPLEMREAKKIREIVIVVDTSYSTRGELVEGFLRETFQILSQRNSFFSRCRIRVLQCDERVQRDTLIKSQGDLERMLSDFSIYGGGSTDFRPAFSYVEELRRQGEIGNLGGLLYFTDGKGTYPEKKTDYKTAFLFLDDYEETKVPLWAMRLQLDSEEFLNYEH
ncbi:MAG: metallopeptidase [Lachnospiraceae bacterium]|nr:metallopeptidase [Lachnospiraceae bacterium]